MAFDIAAFRAQLQGDAARPNLFQVDMPFPAFSVPGNAPTKLSFMAHSAQLPGSTVGTVPVLYFGREIKIAGNRTFPEWTITVYNDEDFVIRSAFERWLNGLNSHGGNQRNASALSATSYGVDALVTQFGKTGAATILKQYNFIGMWPTDLSPIDVSWSANDQIEEFTVTLSYQWWEDVTNGVI